jgi:PAS domain S-box-containing protein
MPDAVVADARSEPTGPRAEERRNRPVAVWLALFAAGTLIPVLLIVTWMLIDTARLRRDDSLRDARGMARHVNATIDVEMEKAIAVGQTLATSHMLPVGDYAAFDAQARDVGSRLGIFIVLRDLSGQQLVNSGVPAGTPLPVSDPPILATDRQVLASRQPAISDLISSSIRKTPYVFADVPVFRGQDIYLTITVALAPARLSTILSGGLPDGWIAGLLGRDGRLIARSADADRFLGTINRRFVDAATEPEGSWSGTDREGEAIAGAYIRSPLSGWLVSVAVPETILGAPARTAMFWLFVLVVASLAVSGVLGWRLARRIALPLRDLVAQARALGEGRRAAVGHSSIGEVNEVAEALRQAAMELERRAAAAEQAAAEVRANEERLQLLQATAGIGTVDWDIVAGGAVCSPRCHELLGLAPDTAREVATFLARLHPTEREHVERIRAALLASGGGPFAEGFRIVTPEGEERWIHVRGRLDLEAGRPVRLLAAGIDITARERSEQHSRFLMRELSHRSKNLLAVIQAMAGQTAKSAETVDDFKRRFGERLMGMAASHDLLVNQNWLGASVEHLVRGQLASFVDAGDPRLRIDGPAVHLRAEAVEAIGLALHELATNSLKYGALSNDAGMVEIAWEVVVPEPEPNVEPEADPRRFRMDWIEHTAVPVAPPTHKGFGRMVIEPTVDATLRGRVKLEWLPEGLRWRLDAPATCLASAGDATGG